jgi:50S ribosomal subunit-associated GTPase HflX
VIVVDFSQPKSLESVNTWINEIYAKADIEEPVIMILANKRDLDPSKKLITNK